MQTITIESTLSGSCTASQIKGCVYVVRIGDHVLYVGKATSIHVCHRFQMHLGQRGPTQKASRLGEIILQNAPVSYQWHVDLLTIQECNEFLQVHGVQHRVRKVNTAERALIHYYHPSLNVQSNNDPRPLPRNMKHRS